MAKKTATKKPAKKPAAPAIIKTKVKVGGFNLLARGATMVDAVKETMAASAAKVKNNPGDMYGTVESHKRLIVPLPRFPLCYAFNATGLISRTLIDIIGPDFMGKTTLIYTLIGFGMMHNSPGAHIETEGKEMTHDRIKQALHPNKEIAEKMFGALYRDRAFELRDAVSKVHRWLTAIRDPANSDAYVPIEIPAIVALDTFSKLMTPTEIASLAQYGVNFGAKESGPKKEEKPKTKAEAEKEKKAQAKIIELGGGSNFGHAKMAAAWCRQLPFLLNKYNAILILGRHQNDKIDMSGFGGGSLIPPENLEGINRTSIGGRSFNQNAAYQIILSKKKAVRVSIKGEQVQVGQYVQAHILKNSFGSPRKIDYLINQVNRRETDTTLDPALDFDINLPSVLKQTGLVKIVENQHGITCEELGVKNVDIHAFVKAFYTNQAFVLSLQQRLKMTGHQSQFAFPEPNPELIRLQYPGEEFAVTKDVGVMVESEEGEEEESSEEAAFAPPPPPPPPPPGGVAPEPVVEAPAADAPPPPPTPEATK